MLRSFFSTVFIAATAIGFSPLAEAADRDWVHYNDFLKRAYLDRFYSTPATDRDTLVVKTMLRSDEKIALEIKVPTAAGLIVLRPDDDNLIEVPYSEALVKADPMLMISTTSDVKLKVGFSLQTNLALKETYSAAEVARPIDQSNALIKSKAGMMSFMFPTAKRFMLRFPAGSVTTVTVGSTTFRPDKDGRVFVAIDDALRKANPGIICSHRPIAVDID